MKTFICFVIAVTLTACGTIGGTVSGLGKDLTAFGNQISK